MSRRMILTGPTLLIALAIAPVAASQSQSQPPTPPQTAAQNTPLAADRDEDFVKDIAQASEVEIATSKVALTKATNAEVKAFAQMMIDDHTAASAELGALVKSKNAEWPPDDVKFKEKKQKHEDLDTLSGAEFDKEYLDDMIDDHESVLARVGRQTNSGKDAEIKAFATKMQPKLMAHLKMARDLKAKLFKN